MKKRKSTAFSLFMVIIALFIWGGTGYGSCSAFTADQPADVTPVQSGGPSFSDLSVSSPIYPYVRYLASKGMIRGYPDGTFQPENGLTRAQAVRLIILAKGLQPFEDTKPYFRDVPKNYWAYSDIEAAVKAGLITGYPDGTFKPDKPITRAEAVSLLLKLSSGGLSDDNMAVADVSPENWVYRQVVTAVEAGLAELSVDKLFSPDVIFTRSDMAKFLSAMFTLSPDLRDAVLTGTLVVKKGQVTIVEGDGTSHTANSDTVIGTGMTIITGDQSQAEITYEDGSGIMLDADTEIGITRSGGFNYMNEEGQPKVAVDKLIIKIKKGKIFGALATRYENGSEEGNQPAVAESTATPWWDYPYSQRERISIEMPWGTTGIRGTFWMNEVSATGQSTAVITGHAVVSSTGQTVSVTAGQSTTILSVSAPPAPPAVISQAQAQALLSAQSFIIQRAQEIQNNLPPPPAPAIQPPQQTLPAPRPSGTSETPQQTQQQIQQQPVDIVSIVTNALNQVISDAAPNPVDNAGSNSTPPPYTPLPPIPTYTVTGTSVNNGGDTVVLNFSQGMDTQTLNQGLIRQGNVFRLYWSGNAAGNNQVAIPLSNAVAAWTGNQQLTITLDESTDQAFIPSEKYLGVVLDSSIKSGAGVSVPVTEEYSEQAVPGETTAPSLRSWTLNMDTDTMALTFDEPVNPATLDMSKISITTGPAISVPLSGSICSNEGFNNTLSISLSEQAYGFIQTQNTLSGTPNNSCYIELTEGVVQDIAGNLSNPLTDSANLLAHFEPVQPKLEDYTCLNNKDGGTSGKIEDGDSIVLEFTKAMDTTTIGTSFDVSVTDGSSTSGSSVITIAKSGSGEVLCTITATNQQYSSNGTIYFNSSTGIWDQGDIQLIITLDNISGGTAASSVSENTSVFTLGDLAIDSDGYSGSGKTTNGVISSSF